MKVNRKDGTCRECQGTLTIIDVDDATMTVTCDQGHEYVVEQDAFNDGAMIYAPAAMMAKFGDDEED